MGVDGGRIAARGFQYQYLRTVEALLAGLDHEAITACRVEGPTVSTTVAHADSVDFDMVDQAGNSLLAVQVKSAGPTRAVRAREAVAVLVHLITGFEARAYRLITSASPDEKCMRLAEALRRYGSDTAALQREIKALLERSPAAWALCEALSPQQWDRLGRARIEFDPRSDAQLREDLNETLRSRRSRSGLGLSNRSGGLVLGYLVAEVMRRAADPGSAYWPVADFQRLLLTEDEELFAAAGRQDFGLLYGPVPPTPEVSRSDLLDRVETLLTPPAHDSGSVPVAVLTGLSGLGKSSLAAAYVAEHAFRYDAVFWVEAETEEALISSFARMLGHLTGACGPVEVTDPRLLRERVHALLQSLAGPWLMVFDDATARTTRAWIPRRGRGAVVVTSLGGNWREARGIVELAAMRPAQAAELVRLRLGLSESEAALHDQAVQHLTQALECWPLAIEVACGYLVSCGIGVSRLAVYADTLLQRAADDEEAVPPGYPRTLAAAVALSVERLVDSARSRDLVEPTLAALAALCRLAPRRVPVHLALACALIGTEHLPPSPGWLVFDEAEHPVREVFRELTNVSLVRRDEPLPARQEAFPGSEDTVSMNAVLQVILARHLQLSRTASRALPQAAGHTNRWLLGAIETGQADRAWELSQHATALVRHIEDADVADLHTCLLMGNLAAFHLAHGQYETARQLLEQESVRLARAGDPDPGVTAQVESLLAHIAQLRQPADAADRIADRADRVLTYLLAQPTPLTPAAVDLATSTALVVQTQLRMAHHPRLAALLEMFTSVTDAAPDTEKSQAARDLMHISELLSEGESERAEHSATVALAATRPWTVSASELRRLLIEAYVRQDKWQEADAALTDFLPCTGPHSLHGFSVHHLVHNAGGASAWQWVTTGDPRAVAFLGRLLEETGIDESPALETATDHARFLLLRVVHGMWRAYSSNELGSAPLDLMRQLTDKTFTEPYDPDNVWERIYDGLLPRVSIMAGDLLHHNHQAQSETIISSAGEELLADPMMRAVYDAARCSGRLALSSDSAYAALAGTSNLDVVLPEFRRLLPGPRAMAFLEPVTMLGVTSTASGRTTELQIHRACDKGFRRLFGNGSSVPSAGQISLTLTGRELVLRHEDGTVLARADVRASGQWLRAARARQTVMVYYGYGLDLKDDAVHRRLFSSPSQLAERLADVSGKGLLAAAIVSVDVRSGAPQEPEHSRAAARRQPKKTNRRARSRRGR
ncbi:ATP-binding protein [Streptomyces reticuli]|uniref:ATP-binding protein n=1 Tax=Streptomyces reticuli TaxID=1926 RepID=UPI00073DBF0F|nr:ATP-binding protein [Streptomyces sp. SID7810]CUW25474.1 hypothetical protein TUE45_00184 [Streptomyces reticuli]